MLSPVSTAILCLLALAAQGPESVVTRTAKSGPWSATATWEGGKVPTNGAKVLIQQGHRVVYDVQSEQVIRAINIAGALTFAPDKNTRLNVGLIKIQAGNEYSEEGFDCDAHLETTKPGQTRPALEVGTAENPIAAQFTALIRLHAQEGMNPDSCPAIVCCGGKMEFHGAAMARTWVKLGETAKAEDTSLTLAEPGIGWKAGDLLVITATRRSYGARNKGPFTEERKIQSIKGATIILDKPLSHDHLGSGEYRGEVANLSRNVIVESADPEGIRGHTMYHRGSTGSIRFAEFRHLGKKGILGRYSLHFHLVGDTMRGSEVSGNSIHSSHNRWLTIHGTNYLVVRDNVGYSSLGHGYFLEDGTEVYNLLDRNLAVGAVRGKRMPKQPLPFDGNEGAGFWWANSLNSFTRNTAAANDAYGFRFEATQTSAKSLTLQIRQPDGQRAPTDIRTLPFIRFDNNEAHSSIGLYGVNLGEGVNRAGPDTRHPFIIRNLKIWDVHYGFRPQVPSLLVENLQIHDTAYGIYHPNYDNHVYRNVSIAQVGSEPFNRGHDDDSVQHGMLTVEGLTFEKQNSGVRMPLIQISDQNPAGKAESHFRNVQAPGWKGHKERAMVNRGGDGPRPEPKHATGVPVYLHDWFGPGRHALVVSTASPDYKKADPRDFRKEALLTGDESRVKEVTGVEFPKALNPVDDFPPVTIITSVRKVNGKLIVGGVAHDNGEITAVLVNGEKAKLTKVLSGLAEWEAEIPLSGDGQISAGATDQAGNVEKTPHQFQLEEVIGKK